MSLVLFIIFCICTIAFFLGFVILELHPRLHKSVSNLFTFQLGAVIGVGALWGLLYYLSGYGNDPLESIWDIVLLFGGLLGGIVGGGLLFVWLRKVL